MHSIDHYDTLRRGREELLRQAERERMARTALLKRKTNWTVRSALIRLTNPVLARLGNATAWLNQTSLPTTLARLLTASVRQAARHTVRGQPRRKALRG